MNGACLENHPLNINQEIMEEQHFECLHSKCELLMNFWCSILQDRLRPFG
jgi:hypothetical protein